MNDIVSVTRSESAAFRAPILSVRQLEVVFEAKTIELRDVILGSNVDA